MNQETQDLIGRLLLYSTQPGSAEHRSAMVAAAEKLSARSHVATPADSRGHERRVVGHVSGWQEQMDTCVCGKPWPCPSAASSTPPSAEFHKWLDTYRPGIPADANYPPGIPATFDRGDMAACWYASNRATVSATLTPDLFNDALKRIIVRMSSHTISASEARAYESFMKLLEYTSPYSCGVGPMPREGNVTSDDTGQKNG